jgi:hypothetical protein
MLIEIPLNLNRQLRLLREAVAEHGTPTGVRRL